MFLKGITKECDKQGGREDFSEITDTRRTNQLKKAQDQKKGQWGQNTVLDNT